MAYVYLRANQKGNIIKNDNFGFIRTCVEAFTSHRGIVLNPDIIWITIISQVSLYFKYNHEKLRRKYVNFEGKKEINIIGGDFDNNHRSLLNLICEETNKYILDNTFLQWVKTRFSTSDDTTQIVKSIMMLGTMSGYFDYTITECGLSEIIIEGNKDDWITVSNNIDKILEFDYDRNKYNVHKWYLSLKTFVSEIIDTIDGCKNINFWDNFVSKNNNSGGPYINGNVLALSEFYEDDGTMIQRNNNSVPIVCLNDTVNITINNNDLMFNITAGNIGFKLVDENLESIVDYRIKKINRYDTVDKRLKTFDIWNYNVNKYDLSSAGFYKVNDRDKVKCFKCGIVIYQWEYEDVPIEEHRKYSPECEFLRMK